jgi:uncharacterized protein (TIGR03437 family)
VGVLKRSAVLCVLCAAVALATPKLRLQTTTVGPIFVNAGQNGTQQSVEAYNAGDGTLSLTVTSNVSWLTASIGTPYTCDVVVGFCLPVNVAFATSALAQGLYTGVLTVGSPNAIDAPQTITVTVQVGSGVPNSMDLYVAAGATASGTFGVGSTVQTCGSLSNSPCPLVTKVTNPPSGLTLSVIGSGSGSFFFTHTYTVTTMAPANTPDGDYTGGVAISGSATAADNRNMPVTVHVTSQPIAVPSPQAVTFRIAQGGAPGTQYIVMSNSGKGTLAVSSVTFGSSGTPSWLKVTTTANLVALTADPTGLSPGVQTATASVASNARNGPVTVPIELDVLAPGPPITYFQGVLDNATFTTGQALAPGEIVALFGEQLIAGPPAQASSLPLGTSLGGASVTVNGSQAPVYYVSANQIDFLIPYGTVAGNALVSVSRAGQAGNTVTATITSVAPRILPLGIGNYGNIVLGSDLVTRPMPATPGIASRPAVAGTDSLVIYALGLGVTTPPVADGVGAPASQPLAQAAAVQVFLGPLNTAGAVTAVITPLFAGLTPGLVGLYQINIAIPALCPVGNAVPLTLQMGNVNSNTVAVAIQSGS